MRKFVDINELGDRVHYSIEPIDKLEKSLIKICF